MKYNQYSIEKYSNDVQDWQELEPYQKGTYQIVLYSKSTPTEPAKVIKRLDIENVIEKGLKTYKSLQDRGSLYIDEDILELEK